jgi:hypothetical protein
MAHSPTVDAAAELAKALRNLLCDIETMRIPTHVSDPYPGGISGAINDANGTLAAFGFPPVAVTWREAERITWSKD